jgi:hypothetical protein
MEIGQPQLIDMPVKDISDVDDEFLFGDEPAGE